MSKTVESLLADALRLDASQRAELADRLVESLDADELDPIDRSWIAVARSRRDEVRSGAVKSVDAAEALRTVRDALRR